MFQLDESKHVATISYQISFKKLIETYREIVAYNVKDFPPVEKACCLYLPDKYNQVTFYQYANEISSRLRLAEASLRSAHSLAKKKKSNVVISGRDGYIYFIVSGYYGIPCIWFPFWSRNNMNNEEVCKFIQKKSGDNPVFLDTGFSGSIFSAYKANLGLKNCTFLLSSHVATDWYTGKESEERKNLRRQDIDLQVQTHRWKEGRRIVLDMEHWFSHPVSSGFSTGELSLGYKMDEGDILADAYAERCAIANAHNIIKQTALCWDILSTQYNKRKAR